MKKIMYLFLLFSTLIFGQSYFEKGNQSYQNKNYPQAIISYQKILQTGQESAEVYYNLGNCYYKLQQIGPAIYNYEKGLQLSPNNPEIQNNLEYAKKLTTDGITPTQTVGFGAIVQNIATLFTSNTWAYITIVCSVLFLVFFLGYYFLKTIVSKKISFAAMCCVLIVGLLSIIFGFTQKNYTKNKKYAIVFAKVAPVKSEPNPSGIDTFILHEGTKVEIIENLGSYNKIKLPDLKEGWIIQSDVKEIK